MLFGPRGVVEVSAEKFFKSSALSADVLRETVKELNIKTVIDFREKPDEIAEERAALEGTGVRHISLPTPQVPNEETVAKYLEILDDEDIYPVLIHCEHGYGRAELFSAIYRMEYMGWNNDDARAATRPALRLPFSSFAPDKDKGAYLVEYKTRDSSQPTKETSETP